MNSIPLRVDPVARADWPALFERFTDSSFEQSSTYAESAARRIRAQVLYLGFWRGTQPIAAAALRIKALPGLDRGIAWCPSGPLLRPEGAAGDPAAALAALCDAVARRRGHVLRLRPAGTAFLGEPPADLGLSRLERSYVSCALDLGKDDAALMAGLQGKWRTELRAALKSGLQLEHGNSAEFQARFLRIFDALKLAKGFQPDITPQFHFALDGADYRHEVLIATRDGQDVAGIVVGHSGACSTYLFGATAPAGRPLRAGYFLTWEALRLARARGALWYDMGGIDPVANPDVARFKERMNGVPIAVPALQAPAHGAGARLILTAERLYGWLRGRRAGPG